MSNFQQSISSMLKSFYTLEMYIRPGGGRQALLFIANSIAEIQSALQMALADNFQLYLLLRYGEDIRICAYQTGELVRHINLLPYIIVEMKEYGTFTIDEHQAVTPDFSEELGEILLEGDLQLSKIQVIINWSKLEIPTLVEPLLLPGEPTLYYDHYTDENLITPEYLKMFVAAQGNPDYLADLAVGYYGWNDREGGEVIDEIELFGAIATEASRVIFQ
jgi:hypothetical protein